MRSGTGQAAGRDGLDEILDELVPCLSARVDLEALVLFGSRAEDDAFEESDWDFAVISADFERLDPLARGQLTVDCRLPLVDLVHLTPQEIMEPGRSYLRCAILEHGETVLDRGAFARARERYQRRKADGEITFHGAVIELATA